LGILAAIAIPRFAGFTDQADAKAAEADARTVLSAVSTLVAGGATTVTVSDVEDLTGGLQGTLSNITVSGNDISFTYTIKDTTVTVTNGVIQ
jgi:type IV pilus assembly protein PilA